MRWRSNAQVIAQIKQAIDAEGPVVMHVIVESTKIKQLSSITIFVCVFVCAFILGGSGMVLLSQTRMKRRFDAM